MKAKSYKLKYIPTTEQLIKLGAQPGGTWINYNYRWTNFIKTTKTICLI